MEGEEEEAVLQELRRGLELQCWRQPGRRRGKEIQ